MANQVAPRGSSLGSLRSHAARSTGLMPSLLTSPGTRRAKVEPLGEITSPASTLRTANLRLLASPARAVVRRGAAHKVSPSSGCSTPSTGPGSAVSSRRGSFSLGDDADAQSGASSWGMQRCPSRGSTVVDMLRARRSNSSSSLGLKKQATPGRQLRATIEKPEELPCDGSTDAESADEIDSATSSCPSSSRSRALPGSSPIPERNSDIVEVCKLAKAMYMPVQEMQEPYRIFKEHAQPVDSGASLLKEGFLTKAQFGQIVRSHFHIRGNEREAERWTTKAFAIADRTKSGKLSFEDFATWMVSHAFDTCLNINAREGDLRDLAKECGLSLMDMDKYRRLFDELDENKNGRIENCEFENMLFKCGNIPRDIGLSAARRQSLWRAADPSGRGSISFEEFLVFNVKYFASGAKGFDELCC